jgi:hypothetical protein
MNRCQRSAFRPVRGVMMAHPSRRHPGQLRGFDEAFVRANVKTGTTLLTDGPRNGRPTEFELLASEAIISVRIDGIDFPPWGLEA